MGDRAGAFLCSCGIAEFEDLISKSAEPHQFIFELCSGRVLGAHDFNRAVNRRNRPGFSRCGSLLMLLFFLQPLDCVRDWRARAPAPHKPFPVTDCARLSDNTGDI